MQSYTTGCWKLEYDMFIFLFCIYWSNEFIMMPYLSEMEEEIQKQFQGFWYWKELHPEPTILLFHMHIT